MKDNMITSDEAGDADRNRPSTSRWITVTQKMIDGFAAATLDPDPMHTDPVFAAAGPFGKTIAFGFLSISLLTHLLHDAIGDEPIHDLEEGFALNYGFDRVRLISPVPVDSRVRGHFVEIEKKVDARGRVLRRYDARLEIENEDRPALAAEWLIMWVPSEL